MASFGGNMRKKRKTGAPRSSSSIGGPVKEQLKIMLFGTILSLAHKSYLLGKNSPKSGSPSSIFSLPHLSSLTDAVYHLVRT